MKYLSLVFFVSALLVFTACAQNSNELGAPEISYGQDVCDECAMLINDAKFAAATIDTKGNPHKFDDIGGMILFHMKHPESQVRAYFVHDYNTQAWLRGENAFYVKSNQIDAPMGEGVVAFEKKSAAEEFAARVNGAALTFDELRIDVHVTQHAE